MSWKKTSSKATGVDIVEIFQFKKMEWMKWTVPRTVLSCWVNGSNSLRRNKSWANKLHGPKESYSLWLHCVFHFSTGTGREKQMEGHLPGTGGRRRKYRSQEGELPNQLVYAGMTETKNLLFYQALLWMGKFKKDESKRDGLPSGRSYRSPVRGRNSDISWSKPVRPSSDNFPDFRFFFFFCGHYDM